MTDLNRTTMIATVLVLLTTLVAVSPAALAYPDGCAGGADAGTTFLTATPFAVPPGVPCEGAVGGASDPRDTHSLSVPPGTSQLTVEICYWKELGYFRLSFEPTGGLASTQRIDTISPGGPCSFVSRTVTSSTGGTWYLEHGTIAPGATEYHITYWT